MTEIVVKDDPGFRRNTPFEGDRPLQWCWDEGQVHYLHEFTPGVCERDEMQLPARMKNFHGLEDKKIRPDNPRQERKGSGVKQARRSRSEIQG